jgi:phytoene dehydrogenase-like protein
VIVFEAADRIGGGARSDALTQPGFVHDVCSAVHPLGAASPFLGSLPLAEHGLRWIHPTLLMAHPFDDGSAAVLDRTTAATADSLGADGDAYRRLMDPLVEVWRPLMSEVLAPPIHVPRHPVPWARLAVLGIRSALGLAQHRFDTARARAFFLGIAAHSLLPMDRSPSAAFGLVLALAGHGVGWPFARGGSQAIADALAAELRRHGGRIVTGLPVRSLDALPPAAATLLDLTPRQVLEVAGARLPPRYRRSLRRWRYGPGAFKVDWALAEPIPWTAEACRRAGTVHVGGSAGEIARWAEDVWQGRLDDRPSVILTQPSLFDATRAPPGRHTAWAYCHVPHGSTRDMTGAIERQIERFAPGFRDIVLGRHTMTTAEMESHDENLVGGAIGGGVQDLRQHLSRPVARIDPYRTPVEGLYLCSASTPPGGAVHGMCGFHAARSVLRRQGSRLAAG